MKTLVCTRPGGFEYVTAEQPELNPGQAIIKIKRIGICGTDLHPSKEHNLILNTTADERPCKTLRDRVTIEDLHATLYDALGVSPKLAYEVQQRPFYVTRDGLGQPIRSLFGA